MDVVRDDSPENPRWDEFLAAAPGGHHVQTAAWAKVKHSVGWRPRRVLLTDEGAIVGGAQLLWRELGGVVRVGYVPRGPVVRRDSPGDLALTLDQLEAEARSLGLAYVKVQPPVDRDDMPTTLESRGFTRSRLDVGPSASVRIDVQRSEQELLAAMASRVRRNLRQSDREGLVVRHGNEEDLPTFVEIIERTAQRQQFENYSGDYWRLVWDEFAPAGGTALLLAELDGRPLSALLLVGFGDTAIYKMGGWTGERTKARPNESMHWAAIQWARSAGHRYYDLEGIPPEVARAIAAGRDLEEIEGVAAFKLSLGGEAVLYPGTYDARYQPVRSRVAQWAASQGSGHPFVRLLVGRR